MRKKPTFCGASLNQNQVLKLGTIIKKKFNAFFSLKRVKVTIER
jgi:hypothetical protein